MIKFIVFFGAIILAHSANLLAAVEVSYSKYRFVFDDSSRKDALLISNRGSSTVSCKASLAHFIMGDKGPTRLADSPDEVVNSAEKLLRYSPRNASIAPNSSQVVRLSSRRRPGIKDGEYLSYFKLSCEEVDPEKQKNQAQVSIQSKFVHYFPLQVRVGELSATTHFENANIIKDKGNYKVTVDQHRKGQRSVVGDIEVKDKTGEVLGKLMNVVMYPAHDKRQHNIKLKNAPDGSLEIVFTENKLTLGSLVSRINVKS
jgi:P pilus assembly chaperone PapD